MCMINYLPSGANTLRRRVSTYLGRRFPLVPSNFRPLSTSQQQPKRIIVAITGATGSPLAIALLRRLGRLNIETHLIMSTWAIATLKYELPSPADTANYFSSLATFTYSPKDVSASLSSGSFPTDGMIVVPCSMKTLAGVRMGYDSDLIVRAASVTLKEKRRLVLVARETPLTTLYLENMLKVAEAGAVVMPPCMAFYTRPQTIDEMLEHSAKRMVDLLGIHEQAEEEIIGNENSHQKEIARPYNERRMIWTGFDWARKKTDEAAGECTTNSAK